MAMQFEYDETGSTFYYFMLAFLLIVFIPLSYIMWPFYKDPRGKRRAVPCSCHLCIAKSETLRLKRKNTGTKVLKSLIIVLGWLAVAYFAFKATTAENTHVEYNPFMILEIDEGASTKEIRKAYKALSLIHHPDKGGDEELFVQINKAYQALTDEVTRQNWIDHGNPDGPQAMQFGIALPSWIVDKNNSVIVLGLYVLVFMILLPVVVGRWWYKSIKYSADDILLHTTQLYLSFFAKNSLHNISKCIMILNSAFEFDKRQNKEVKDRSSDNIQLPLLMKECRQLHEKSPIPFFNNLYSIKARTLFHSYCNRSDNINDENLLDINMIIKKMPALINEALNICFQLIYFSKRQKNISAPNVQTFENLIKMNVMAVQATWDNKSPLMQLPHFTDDMLRYFSTKRSNIKSLLQFAQLTHVDRKSRLRMLSEEQYDNLMRVLWGMPHIEMDVKSEVLDDENTMTISASSIVTVTCFLDRKSLRDVIDEVEESPVLAIKEEEEKEPKKKSWQKPQKKQKTAQKKKKPVPKKKAQGEENKENETVGGKERGQEDEEDGDDENEEDSDIEKSDNEESRQDSEADDGGDEDSVGELDDEREWSDLQAEIRQKKKSDGEIAESHPVHCPYFPVDKEEGWWVFIADRKTGEVITAPKYVAGLKDKQEVILKFQAPDVLGHHKYNVILKSDCYINCEKEVLLKLFVEREIRTKAVKQWDNISDSDESETESEVTESESEEEEESD